MPEEKLNLIQFATGSVTESRTRATEILLCKLLDASLGRGAPDNIPEHLRRHALAPDSTRLVDRAKDASVCQTRRLRPDVDDGLHPRGNRDRADVSALADQIGDDRFDAFKASHA